MVHRYRLVFLALLFPLFVSAQSTPDPKFEFRSVWLTTAGGLDWPKSTDPAVQQSSLRDIIRQAKAMGLNAITFQVASRGDSYYRSDRLPWSSQLTGTIGRDPGWDPLQFLIDECRAQGLEVHAWYNVFNVGSTTVTEPGAPQHITQTAPTGWIRSADGSTWLNPGYSGARDWVVANVVELLSKYDVDAINFDFMRYPGPFDDDFGLWLADGRGISSTSDWRRDNVTDIPRRISAWVTQNKPWVKVGSAPIGHYKTSGGWPALYAYSGVFQDSRSWLKNGYMDYLMPQIYWKIYTGPYTTSPEHSWIVRDYAKETYGRHVYTGIGAYVEGTVQQIPRMIDTTRVNNLHGQVYFRWLSVYGFQPATGGFAPLYTYRRPAIVPPMPWRSQVAPPAPVVLDYNRVGNTHVISWAKGLHNDRGDTLQRFAIYRSATLTDPAAIIADPANLIGLSGGPRFTSTGISQNTAYTYVVTSLSRNNVESAPSNALSVPSATGIDDADIAEGYALSQNFPNPFNPTTVISYQLPVDGDVNLAVYDAVGRRVAVLVEQRMSAGSHSVTFDASQLASGVYVYVLTSGDIRLTHTMTLVK